MPHDKNDRNGTYDRDGTYYRDGTMADFFHRPPKTNPRPWTIPIPSEEYKDGWDRIFLDNKINKARYRLALLENNDAIGAVDPKDITKARDELYELLEAEKASGRVEE